MLKPKTIILVTVIVIATMAAYIVWPEFQENVDDVIDDVIDDDYELGPDTSGGTGSTPVHITLSYTMLNDNTARVTANSTIPLAYIGVSVRNNVTGQIISVVYPIQPEWSNHKDITLTSVWPAYLVDGESYDFVVSTLGTIDNAQYSWTATPTQSFIFNEEVV